MVGESVCHKDWTPNFCLWNPNVAAYSCYPNTPDKTGSRGREIGQKLRDQLAWGTWCISRINKRDSASTT